ncbi:hypothetical protein SLE2022_099750 [Rubroshorea leprosula]
MGGASDLGLARACGGRWWYGLGPARGLEWTVMVWSWSSKGLGMDGDGVGLVRQELGMDGGGMTGLLPLQSHIA